MAIYCPYCAHKLKIDGIRSGTFAPACPDCGGKFLLKVPQNLADKWVVGAIKSELESGRTIAQRPAAGSASAKSSQSGSDADDSGDQGALDMDLDLDLDMGLDESEKAALSKKKSSAASTQPPQKSAKPSATKPADPKATLPPKPKSTKPAPPAKPAKPADEAGDLDTTMASVLSDQNTGVDDTGAIELDLGEDEDEDEDEPSSGARPNTPRDKSADTSVTMPGARKVQPESRPQSPSQPPPRKPAPAAPGAPGSATMPSTRTNATGASPKPRAHTPPPAKPEEPLEAQIVEATLASPNELPVAELDATLPSQADISDATLPSMAGRNSDANATQPSGIAPVDSLDEADIKTVVATVVAENTMPATLNGYQIVKELGRGGMGAVYLARQLSLDRQVAVKTMNPQWANNPTFLSRFTREAYAAAQLVHHNVVQIYDIGEDKNINYFSMEFVAGQSLGDLLDKQGKLDPEVAVGYTLQAARGLKFAHERGMIHRDVKPDNLMLNEHGIVKVADLGLVKTPDAVAAEEKAAAEPKKEKSKDKRASMTGANVTQANVAMGTPMYMAPEQAADAASVDGRADIYSLGCTLYTLVTGRPVFEGKTVAEVLTKHATEPVIPPEVIVKRVPKALSGIILKMVAKQPEERYQNLDEVIKDLEQFLGLETSGPFTPKEEHAEKLEAAVKQFNGAKTAKLRKNLIRAFTLGLPVLIVLAGLQSALLSGGLLGLYVLTFFGYFVLTGITQKTFVFRKFRQLVFTNTIGDWLMLLMGAGLFVGGLVIFNLHWFWLGFCLLAVGVAFGFHLGLDRKLRSQRQPAVDDTEKMLKSMRLFGLDEDAIHQFVCKYAGDDWEEFFEALFGYESKLEARQRWGKGQRGENRRKHAAWRDALVTWMEARMKAREEARQRKHLQKIEAKSLQAQGKTEKEAQKEAARNAKVLVAAAAQMKAEASPESLTLPGTRAGVSAPAAASGGPRIKPVVKDLLDPSNPNVPKVLLEEERAREGLMATVLGGRGRFILGAALVALCFYWLHQANLIGSEQASSLRAAAQAGQAGAGQAKDLASGWLKQLHDAKPLALPAVPESITTFIRLNAGLAGIILIISSFFRGIRMGFLALAAAGVALVGAMFIPTLKAPVLGPIDPTLSSSAAALLLAVVGLFLGKRVKGKAKAKVGEELLDTGPAESGKKKKK